MRSLFASLLTLVLMGCATPSQRMHWSCVPDAELGTAAAGGVRWRAIPTPASASALVVLRNPSRADSNLLWFEASDGRVSACDTDRYGSSFVIYSDATQSARVLDEGGEIILIH